MNLQQEKRIIQVESCRKFHRLCATDDEAKWVLETALNAFEDEPVWKREISFWRSAFWMLMIAVCLLCVLR